MEPVDTAFAGFVVNRFLDVITSFKLISGFKVVPEVVIIGILVAVVTTVPLDVNKVVSLLLVVDETDMNVSGISSVEVIVGPVVSSFDGFVVDSA